LADAVENSAGEFQAELLVVVLFDGEKFLVAVLPPHKELDIFVGQREAEIDDVLYLPAVNSQQGVAGGQAQFGCDAAGGYPADGSLGQSGCPSRSVVIC
jgi:hypothetical protein